MPTPAFLAIDPYSPMVFFAQLRGRIGAAGMMLRSCNKGTSSHVEASERQANALLSLLRSHGHEQLSVDEKTRVMTMVYGSGFAQKDLLAIITLLNSQNNSRRSGQDMTAFPLYLSLSEWETAKQNIEAAIAVCIDVIVHRLGGVNADEFTLKRISSLALAIFHGRGALLVEEVKVAILKQVKCNYRKVVRRVKEYQKTTPSSLPYIVKLPLNPEVLEQAHPQAGFKIKGCWTDPPLNMPDLYAIDQSYGCRKRDSMAEKNSSHGFMQCMLALKDMMCNGQGRARDLVDDGCHIQYNLGAQSSNKRSLRDLMEGMNLKKPRRSSSELSIELSEDAEAAAATQELPQAAPSSLAIVLNDAPQATATTAAATENPTAAAITTLAIQAQQQPQPQQQSQESPTMGNMLLDAMIQRDQEKAKERAEKQREERAEKQKAKAAAALEQKAKAAAAPELPAKAAAAPAAATPELPISAATPEKPPKKAPPKPPKPQKPGVSHEASRSQWLARSANNGSKSFKYGAKREFLTDSKAKAAAEAWLAEQKQ